MIHIKEKANYFIKMIIALYDAMEWSVSQQGLRKVHTMAAMEYITQQIELAYKEYLTYTVSEQIQFDSLCKKAFKHIN